MNANARLIALRRLPIAVLVAGKLVGLSSQAIQDIFYANGKAILDRVRRN